MIAEALLSCLLGVALPQEATPRELVVGHWIEVRGNWLATNAFDAEKVEVLEPQEYNVLQGTVTQDAPYGFQLLGQRVHVSDKTTWLKVTESSVVGQRVKVEGYWRGPLKFSARQVALRGGGRDRISGRIDVISPTADGLELRVMGLRVLVPPDVQLVHDHPLDRYELAQATAGSFTSVRDDDDQFGVGIRLTDGLLLTGQLEFRMIDEDEFDLDPADDEDRTDTRAAARLRLNWTPASSLTAVAEVRHTQLWRDDEDDGRSSRSTTRFGETYLHWDEFLGTGWNLRVGRQDFDEEREWIHDQNLDGLRLYGEVFGLSTELALVTSLEDGPRVDRDSTNLIAYVSNGDEDKHLAGWLVHRDFASDTDLRRSHVGLRALGDWIPDNRSWLDVAVMRGDSAGQEQVGWGYDVGTTWSPDALSPVSLTLGYALGSGGDPAASTDRTFRQTGFQDNTARFEGVTSFRYYGELLDPELSNLGIFTLGVGIPVARRASLDIVLHHYRQDVALPTIINSDLESNPNGSRADLGWELDLVLGVRSWRNWDLEVVGAWFDPTSAFTDNEDAQLLKLQLRRRF